MAKAHSYEPAADVNSVELNTPAGTIRLDKGKPYSTSDPAEQQALEDHPSVRRAGKEGK